MELQTEVLYNPQNMQLLAEKDMEEVTGSPYVDLPLLLLSIRKEAKLTQQQLADKLGVKVNTYESWESGRYTPSGQYLLELLLLRAKNRNVNLKALFRL